MLPLTCRKAWRSHPTIKNRSESGSKSIKTLWKSLKPYYNAIKLDQVIWVDWITRADRVTRVDRVDRVDRVTRVDRVDRVDRVSALGVALGPKLLKAIRNY